jgi:hypothetical protein
MSRACAVLSDLDFYSDDSSSSEEDERPKRKIGDFIDLCLMGKASRHISHSDSDVSDDSSLESLSLRVVKLENALCNQDKLLCKVFRENKKLNLQLKSASSEIVSLRSAHDDMSAKPCDKCNMIMVNYVDLWLVHSHIASLLDSVRLELSELKAHSTLVGACTSCPLLRSDLEAAAIEIKDLKYKLDHSSRYTILSPPCEACVSLKGKLFHATKENTQLQQEVAYLTANLEKTVLSEKMIEEDKVEKSAPKFIPSSSYHKEKATIKSTKAHYPSKPKPSFNPKREAGKETSKPREQAFICMFCGRAGHLDEFCFQRKRIERRRAEYARDSYHDEFIDFPPCSYSRIMPRTYSRASPRTFSHALSHTSSCASPQFAQGPNHRSYGFGPRENRFVPRYFGYGPHPHRGDCFPCRPGFPVGGAHTHFEPRHLDDPYFPHRGLRSTWPNGELERIVKTSSGCMVKC